MNYSVVNLAGEVVGSVDLGNDVFGYDPRADIIHRVVVWQLAKRRSGTHQTKTISMISGTTRKPYAQKGTGRARQGSLRSAQFRGGAVAHGPVAHSHEIKLPKKMRKLGLCHALSDKLQSGSLMVVESLNVDSHKTSDLNNVLKQLDMKSALFIDVNEQNQNFRMACSNIIGINVLPVAGLNVYDIMRHKNLVISKEALSQIEERLSW